MAWHITETRQREPGSCGHLERSIRVKIRHESINHTVRSPLETALDDSRLDKQGETRQYQPIVAAHEVLR